MAKRDYSSDRAKRHVTRGQLGIGISDFWELEYFTMDAGMGEILIQAILLDHNGIAIPEFKAMQVGQPLDEVKAFVKQNGIEVGANLVAAGTNALQIFTPPLSGNIEIWVETAARQMRTAHALDCAGMWIFKNA